MNDRKTTFLEKLYEREQHKKRLLVAKRKLKPIMPLDVVKYKNLSDEEMSFIDQMIFRFSKLQDTMGEKIFPTLLLLSGEEIKNKTFIDRLNRLEELELVNKNEWMQLRKERNEIAHEYSFNQVEIVDGINTIYNRVNNLLTVYEKIIIFSKEKFEISLDEIKRSE